MKALFKYLVLILLTGGLGAQVAQQFFTGKLINGTIAPYIPPPIPPVLPTNSLFIWYDYTTNYTTAGNNRVTNWVDRISSLGVTNNVDLSGDYIAPSYSNSIKFDSVHHSFLLGSNAYALGPNLTMVAVFTNQYLNNGLFSFNRIFDHQFDDGAWLGINNTAADQVGGGFSYGSSPYASFVQVNTNANKTALVVINVSNGCAFAYNVYGTNGTPVQGVNSASGAHPFMLGNYRASYLYPWNGGLLHFLLYTNTAPMAVTNVTAIINYFSNAFYPTMP